MPKECGFCGFQIQREDAIECPECGGGIFFIKERFSRKSNESGVFVSYSRADFSRAKTLVSELKVKGGSIWFDDGRIRAGEDFKLQIDLALDRCARVVVLWSASSVKSSWVLREADYGLRHHKLFPVRLDKVHVPERFEKLHTIDLSSWDGTVEDANFQHLLNDLAFFLALLDS